MMSDVFVVWRAVPAWEKSGSSIYPKYMVLGQENQKCLEGVYCRGGRYNRYIGILRFCEQFVPRYVFRNPGISAISGNHRLFPLTA